MGSKELRLFECTGALVRCCAGALPRLQVLVSFTPKLAQTLSSDNGASVVLHIFLAPAFSKVIAPKIDLY